MEQEILPLIDFSKVKKKKKEIPKSETEPEDLSNIMITKKSIKKRIKKKKKKKN